MSFDICAEHFLQSRLGHKSPARKTLQRRLGPLMCPPSSSGANWTVLIPLRSKRQNCFPACRKPSCMYCQARGTSPCWNRLMNCSLSSNASVVHCFASGDTLITTDPDVRFQDDAAWRVPSGNRHPQPVHIAILSRSRERLDRPRQIVCQFSATRSQSRVSGGASRGSCERASDISAGGCRALCDLDDRHASQDFVSIGPMIGRSPGWGII